MTEMVNLGPPAAIPDFRARSKVEEPKEANSAPEVKFSDVLQSRKTDSDAATRPKSISGASGPANSVGAPGAVPKDDGRRGDIKSDPSDNDRSVETDTRTSESDKFGEKKEGDFPVFGKAALAANAKATNLTPRQKVMQKFMDSLESEFGIPPDKVVGAMTHLSDEHYLATPEKSATQVVGKLGLDPIDAEKAEAMYLGMLSQLKNIPTTGKDVRPLPLGEKRALNDLVNMQKGKTDNFMVAAAAHGPLDAAKQTKQRMLNDSLERMNSQFFVKQDAHLPTEVFARETQGRIPLNALNENEKLAAQTSPMVIAGAAGFNRKMAFNPSGNPTDVKETDDGEDELSGILADVNGAANDLDKALKADPENLRALQMEKSMNQLQRPTPEQARAAFAQMAIAAQEARREKGLSPAKGEKTFSDAPERAESSQLLNSNSQIADPGMNSAAKPMVLAGSAEATAAAKPMTPEIKEANIHAIMKQAEYLVKKGGGEAVVQMNPEGLGQVHMKIMLNDGKVNVEMKTQSTEAKQLIENSIGDLRTSLNVHKLAVDHFKVDVNSQLASNHEQSKEKSMGSFQQDPNREQARQFFSQFHEDNYSRREPFYETSAAKAYSQQKPWDPLKPAQSDESVANVRSKNSRSRLDLVA